ncbi:thermostable carboxypeptidase 1 [soil metagenome]
MNNRTSSSYEQLVESLRSTEVLGSVASILSWDQETMLPRGGAELRAEQMAMMSSLVHERQTDPRVGDWIAECETDADLMQDDAVAANIREIRRTYDRAVLLPPSLVREMAQTTSLALQAWRDARERSDFGAFAPWLERVFRLSRSQADCYGATSNDGRYDALLEGYEPGARTVAIASVFDDLRTRLSPLIRNATESGSKPNERLHTIRIPIERQKRFNAMVAQRIGFDLNSGRLDTSTHPFCQSIGPGDTRLTTRYREDGFTDALSSTLHEGGHGLYEQGLPKLEYPGQPLSEEASLGIHESQSRLWENMVGRSRPFWEWLLPLAARDLSQELESISPDEAFLAMNHVEPSFIRVESDEATYNLHIMLRFDLERALLSGDLEVADLPAAWNTRVLEDLGLRVQNDRQGVLQDVHWSMGAIGYFPTYTLGNLYAAQLWGAIRQDLPDLSFSVARGEFGDLLAWLRDRIHRHGRRYAAGELCERASGRPLSADPFIEYLRDKLEPVHGAT